MEATETQRHGGGNDWNLERISALVEGRHTLMVHRCVDGAFALTIRCSQPLRRDYVAPRGRGQTLREALDQLAESLCLRASVAQ